MSRSSNPQLSPGLAGVPVTNSSVSFVDGETGVLEYRGIRIEELVKQSHFLETSYLLLYGEFPAQTELDQFTADVLQHRRIKYRIVDLIKCLPEHGHPMDALQAAVAALGMFYPARNVMDRQVQYWSTIRLIAKVPTIIAAYYRLRRGDEPVQPRDDLDHAGNFFYMLNEKVPDPFMAKALDTCLILHAEHTMNASTFSGLVTASTLADPYTVVSSAIGTLTGPLHGGAAQETVEMLEEIGSVEQVRPYLKKRLVAKQKLMGFGHRIYKVKDPRAIILQTLAQELFAQYGPSPLYHLAEEVERVGEHLLAGKGLHANVDFYSGVLYKTMGLDKDFFSTIFAMARVSGWLAHWLEQINDNKIFRPDQIYKGQHGRAYVPVERRVGGP
ncbi:MAG: citrate synthase [Nitrospirae bacterium CG_4_9_14_3_um_filter_51_5]|nr:MAG: citrate synthase [Nitrospirae bacterium CG_4_9_14_3_um_filter_51_5]